MTLDDECRESRVESEYHNDSCHIHNNDNNDNNDTIDNIKLKRILSYDSNIWDHNAWDNVKWTESQRLHAQQIVSNHALYAHGIKKDENNNNNNIETNNANNNNTNANNSNNMKSKRIINSLNDNERWNQFYAHHDRWFFKDRKWIHTEFPELFFNINNDNNNNDSNNKRILEVGCGAGNTLFPILREYKKSISKYNNNQDNNNRDRDSNNNQIEIKKFLWGCDFSIKALELVYSFREYDSNLMHLFQYDLSSGNDICTLDNLSCSINDNDNQNDNNNDSQSSPSLSPFFDIVIMIFVLSAVPPNRLSTCLSSIWKSLRPGGIILYRDYGKYDLTQLRFKSEQCLSDNLYMRGDGTLVYYQDEQEVINLFTSHGFECIESKTDSRLVVNRLRKLQMHRIWIQCKFRKPFNTVTLS